ncbi:histone methylation protein DOT1-domain-containing protein [Lipomyces japonicus]|uniref:histone methylation protein DOT1-domain-containing protein n=1 Tax=Lipomyces japonicus TaxID=56871 RepID=UPI0034CFC832
MPSSFFQKLSRSKADSESPAPSPAPSPGPSSPISSKSRDIKFKSVKVSRQVQKTPVQVNSFGSSGRSFDILKRLNKRKKPVAAKEKVERVKKPAKEKKEKKAKGKQSRKSELSNEFVNSDDESDEDDDDDDDQEDEEDDDDQDDDDDDDNDVSRQKKVKLEQNNVDENREILDYSWFEPSDSAPKLVSSSSIANIDLSEYTSLFPDEKSEGLYVDLRYPGNPSFTERFDLVSPVKDDYSPFAELERILQIVAEYFLPSDEGSKIYTTDLQDCIVRRIKRSIKRKSLYAVKSAIEEYNEIVAKYFDSENKGQFAEYLTRSLRSRKAITSLSHEVLGQVYARIVSPHVKELRNYEAFSNNVYGELLPRFTSKIISELGITSDKVFVDLGSGVGNCVLQVALEVGAESYGCEIMDKAAELATKQEAELKERVKFWGVKLGPTELIHGDFVRSDRVAEAIKKADVILVNNYAFDAELNGSLVNLFLDVRDGTKIVSLKSFVPPGHKITSHNVESPINLLQVNEREFFSGSVSWTDAPGKYYVSTIDRTKIKEFRTKQEE